MESTTQWCKKRRSQNLSDGKKRNTSTSDSFDRISALPDAVICHILSFLPTKISVSTSILARRWRTLWAHVPNLDFESTNRCLGTSISNVIGRVMLLHKLQSINAFRLSYTDYCEKYAFETWIAAVIARSVRIIDIGLNYQLVVPPCLFTCKTLVDLSLHCRRVIISGTIFLPCLKKLHLSRVNYDDGENLPKLFPGCPVLEELVMRRRKGDGLVCLNISSPSLKSLTLDFPFDHPEYYNHDCKVEISAPAATYLQLTDSMSTPISSQMLTSLTEAEVSFDYNKYSNDDEDDYFQSVYKFLDSLCNVKCLKLSSDIELEHDNAFDDQSGSIRKFHNLTRLELDADWLFVTIFLESADNLEVLIIREGPEYLRLWTEPEQVPACLLSHLKIVRIDNFMFKEHEFELIRYLLMNAKVLDRMEIYSSNYYWFGYKPKFEALQKISLFKRVSEACELAFY